MKIAFVSQSYYPRYSGISENISHSAAVLAQRGHDVTVITGRPVRVGHDPKEADLGLPGIDEVRVIRLGYSVLIPYQGTFVDIVVNPSLRDDLERVWKQENFDVVHLHQPLTPTLPLLTTMTCPGKLVGQFHAAGTPSKLWRFFRNKFAWHFHRIDLRLAVSPSAASFVESVFGESPAIIPNGINTRRFHPQIQAAPGSRDGRFTVLFVGRLDPRKGFDVLLRAWEQVVKELEGEARLNVVGSSALAGWVRSRIPKTLLPTIHFAGAVPVKELPGWYASADVFCSPAIKNESFGMVLLEAMASGLPVVCSDLPGYRAVCRPRQEALLVRPGDANSLAAALTLLARDRQLAKRLGMSGRHRAEGYDWDHVGEALEDLYLGLVSNQPTLTPAVFPRQPTILPIEVRPVPATTV